MRDESSGVRLRVAEGLQTDVGKGLVRVPRAVAKRLGLGPQRNLVEVVGRKVTGAVAVPLYDSQADDAAICMDGLVRANARVSLGEWVDIRAVEAVPAERIVLAPARAGMSIRGTGNALRETLLDRAVAEGDLVSTAIFHNPRELHRPEEFNSSFFRDFFESPAFGLGEVRLVVVGTHPRKLVQITPSTIVELRSDAPEVRKARDATITYDDVGGMHDVVRRLREVVELPLQHPELFERLAIEPPRGVLLYGPPGTGKTLLARAVANECNAYFTTISGPEIVGKYYGESEQRLREVFNDAFEHAPAVVFIDELDAIAPRRDNVTGETERRIVAQLLTLLDGMRTQKRVIVLGATNRVEAIDRALRRPGRFDREIELRVPDERGRLDILRIHTRGMPLEVDVDFVELARRTVGYTGSDLAALARESAMNAVNRWLPSVDLREGPVPPKELARLTVGAADFTAGETAVVPSGMREVSVRVPDVSWTDVGGLEDVKRTLREVAELPLIRPDVFARLGIKPARGILLYGPPGTGKTMLAKAVANEANANFISLKGSEILSKWYGESEKRIEELFRRARQVAPAILFFDEIDSLVPARGQGSTEPQVTGRIVNQFLAEMDGFEDLKGVVVIGATNRPDIVDSALLRPGRFDELVFVPVPDLASREAILRTAIRGVPVGANVDVVELARKTERFTGADIVALVKKAAILAAREDLAVESVDASYFEQALESVQPSVTEDVERYYRKLEGNLRKSSRVLGFRAEAPPDAARR
jgi:transitional endoplasmic reticulum ATPase